MSLRQPDRSKGEKMMDKTEVPVNPRELVRQFRQNYVNAHALKKHAPTALEGAHLSTLKEKPITEGDLPQDLRALLTEYRQSHPQAKVTLVKYQRLENGKP